MASGGGAPWPEVDTSQPFQSVREAVAIFGERILASTFPASTNHTANTPRKATPSPLLLTCGDSTAHLTRSNTSATAVDALYRLQAELTQVHQEVAALKNKSEEVVTVLASIAAQLDKSLGDFSTEGNGRALNIEERTSDAWSYHWDEQVLPEQGPKSKRRPTLACGGCALQAREVVCVEALPLNISIPGPLVKCTSNLNICI